MGAKAEDGDFIGRFREIVSDPLNLLIRRDPRAGFLEGNDVYLHNGLKVPLSGPHAYYGAFSSILVINRGVHEPLEEFVFQELLPRMPDAPTMLELGAYWGHYSMWLKSVRANASVHLVEPELENLSAGKHNFALNGFDGNFIHAPVGNRHFGVDAFLAEAKISKLDVLHCDIQGYELEMLADCRRSLSARSIDYLFISTHSEELHQEVARRLEDFNYRIEVSSDFETETTSFDGFVFASSRSTKPVFEGFIPMGRVEIEEAEPASMLEYLSGLGRARTA